MNTLRITLFGKLSIEQDDHPLTGLAAKALELLCYLLLYRERAHTRETLAEVLWPEASCAQAQKYLRQTLWQLQNILESPSTCQPTAGEPFFLLTPGWVRINPQAAWSLDVAAFEQAYALCRDLSGPELTTEQAQILEEAVGLYQGDFLATWYQDWCIYERDRLQLTYLAMLEKLMSFCEAHQHYARGVTYGHAILRYDPARECTHRQLMRLHYQAGDRTTALRQFDRCAAAVAKEFNLPPAQETVTLYEQIRAERLGDPPPLAPASQQTGAAFASDPLLEVRKQLDRIQASLTALQMHLQQELATISLALHCNRLEPEHLSGGKAPDLQ